MVERPFVLTVNNLRIRGVRYIPEGTGRYPGLIISHGIPAETHDPQDRGYPELAERFCREGFLTAIFNFRGSGLSDGNFEIRGWTRDLAAVTDFIWGQPELDRQSLTLMGFSAGAAVAVFRGALDPRVSAVAACACPAGFDLFFGEEFTRQFLKRGRQIGIIRRKGFPPSLKQWKAGFEEVAPIRWVDRIAPRPLFLLHGSLDEVVPVQQAWQLYRSAGDPKQIRIIEGAGHRLRPEEEAMGAVLDWLKETSGRQKAEVGPER